MRNSKLIKQDVLFNKYGKKFVVDNLVLSDGTNGFWAYLTCRPGVIIVALDKDKNLILVRQYRYTQKDFTYENPAGAQDDESSLDTAKRELFEETGYQSSEPFVYLGKFNDLTNETNHYCEIYLAVNCKYVSPPLLDPYAEKYCEMTTELHPFMEIFDSLGKDFSLIKSTEHTTAIFLAYRYLLDKKIL